MWILCDGNEPTTAVGIGAAATAAWPAVAGGWKDTGAPVGASSECRRSGPGRMAVSLGAAAGFGAQTGGIRMGADVVSANATPGQALTGLGLDFLAGKAGLPGGGPVLGDLLEGRMDRAASGLTQAGLAAALGRAAGIPAPLAGIALQETGLGPKAGAAVGSAVGPSQPTGVTSSITQLFDKGLGGLKEIFSGLPQGGAGTAPAAQTGGVPYYGYASDSSPDSPATVAAPAAPAAPTTPEVQAAQRLLYGIAQGPYGPLLAYDIGGRG